MATKEHRDNLKTKSPSGRPNRKRIGRASRLSFPGLDHENYYYYLFNDTEDRIANAKEAGYELAPEAMDQQRIEGGKTVDGKISVGNGVQGVLMRQPREFHEEDVADKQSEVDRQMAAIENPTLDGQYGKVSIDR